MPSPKTNPSVVAILLTADRPEMTRRAVECFRAQTYENKRLIIIDTGQSRNDGHVYIGRAGQKDRERLLWNPSAGETIGELRNMAIRQSQRAVDICVHWDSDDWSHPNRIAEQVALLQSSGADVVGYREMLFWNDVSRETWLYSNPDPRYCLGTSLCYWRKTWERKPFEATSQGEDARFCAGLNCVGGLTFAGVYANGRCTLEPRMIARIHAGNTSTGYTPENMRRAEWRRAPEWDAHCRRIME
jgi:glycosyltransferase involved in cell wall biosynthesis